MGGGVVGLVSGCVKGAAGGKRRRHWVMSDVVV